MRHKPLYITHLLYAALAVAILSGCNTGNRLASSFAKRRYTKGYFWNSPARVQAIIANNTQQAVAKNNVVENTANAAVVVKPVVHIATARNSSPEAIVCHKAKQPTYKQHIAQAYTASQKSHTAFAQKSINDSNPPPDDNKNRLTTGKIFLIAGVVLLLLAIFASAYSLFIGFPAGVFFVAGLFFGGIGISLMHSRTAPPPQTYATPANNAHPNDYVPNANPGNAPANGNSQLPKTNEGTTGFVFVMVALFLMLVATALFVLAISSGSFGGTLLLGLWALVPSLLGLIFLITGFILCSDAIHCATESHPALAKAGAIISGILLGLMLLGLLTSRL